MGDFFHRKKKKMNETRADGSNGKTVIMNITTIYLQTPFTRLIYKLEIYGIVIPSTEYHQIQITHLFGCLNPKTKPKPIYLTGTYQL